MRNKIDPQGPTLTKQIGITLLKKDTYLKDENGKPITPDKIYFFLVHKSMTDGNKQKIACEELWLTIPIAPIGISKAKYATQEDASAFEAKIPRNLRCKN